MIFQPEAEQKKLNLHKAKQKDDDKEAFL